MNDSVTALDRIPLGSSCTLCSIDSALPIKGRLKELGFCKGAIIDKLHIGCLGSPIACRVCGSVIAVRKADAKMIFVKI